MVKDKIAILGASGFIGIHLCKKLVNENIKILALIRNKNSIEAKELLKMDVQILETGDLFEKKLFSKDLSKIKFLINLAALAHLNSKTFKKKLSYLNNIENNIVRNFSNKNLNILHISSAKVSNNIKNSQTDYEIVKRKGESIIRKYYKKHIILRPPLVYGPNVKANFLILMKAIYNNLPLPFKNLSEKRSYMYIENLIDAILLILKKNHFIGKTYEISDNCLITNEKLVSLMANALGKKAKLFYLNPKLINLMLIIIRKRELFNKIMKEFIVTNKEFISDTGWQPPYHYSEGIKKTCLWYKRTFRM
jgi:nucleoside-diphosphate-sugar epimerase